MAILPNQQIDYIRNGDPLDGTATQYVGSGELNRAVKEVQENVEAVNTALTLNGVSGSRPGTPTTGSFYFDTTLGKPIWFSGTNWVDSAGTTVT